MIRIPILHPGGHEGFPSVAMALVEPNGLLAAGGDLSPQRMLEAYRHGIFPWYSAGEPILWWSPDPRTVFATDKIHISTRLRRWLKHCDWTIRVDSAFAEVVRACAVPRRDQPTTWITPAMFAAYAQLHAMGHAHSLEVYDASARLVGGIYGVAVGRMFYGESMFSAVTNGSKVALIALCRGLHAWEFPLLDAQVAAEHLTSLGAFQIARTTFLAHLADYCARPAAPENWRDKWLPGDAAHLL